MNAPKTDVHRVLTYTDSRVNKQFLVIFLLCGGAGLLGVTFFDTREPEYFGAWVLVIACTGFCLYLNFRLFNPGKPLLTLSPKGLLFRTVGNDIFIPWYEVRGIDAIDFRTWTMLPSVPAPVTFENVTAVNISRDFYEDEIVSAYHALVHHRVWSRTFHSKGDNLVQVCLHQDILPATSEEIRKQVAARWYAFRDADVADRTPAARPVAQRATPPAPVPLSSGPDHDKIGEKVKFLVRWGKTRG